MQHARHRPVRHITHLSRRRQVMFEPAFWNRQGEAYERPGLARLAARRRARYLFAIALFRWVGHANIAPVTQGCICGRFGDRPIPTTPRRRMTVGSLSQADVVSKYGNLGNGMQ